MTTPIDDLKQKILPILQKYGVRRAGLFGSLVRGEAREDSDVDLLVELPEEASLFDLVGLKLEMEESLRRKVDVLTYNGLYPLLREPILSEEVVIL